MSGARHDPAVRMLATIKGQRARLALAALFGTLALASAVGLTAASALLISRAALQPPILFLQLLIVSVRAFGIGRGAFRYAERLVGHDAAFRGLAGLRVRIYQRLERIAPTGLGGWRRGDLMTRLVEDVDSALDLQLRVLLPGLAALGVGAASVALAWWILPLAGLILLVALLVGGAVVPVVSVLAGGAAARRSAAARGELAQEIVTSIESAADLVALQAGGRALAGVQRADADFTSANRRAAYVVGVGAGLGALAQGLAVVGSLLAGAAAVSEGRMLGVLLATVVLLPLAAYEAVSVLPSAALVLVRVRASAARVFEVIDAEPPVREPPAPAPAPVDPAVLIARNLSVRWPGSTRDAVTGVDLELRRGRVVALVGPSGSGKSTLAQALLGFLPYRGELRIDEVRYSSLAGDSIRGLVGLLSQDAHIFDTTVAENLRLARPGADAEDLAAALRDAGLGEWLAGLPDGLQTLVGRHGARLSGGQRQRLALARILLAEHRFVILDEPTEHLDPVEADLVLRTALAALSDRGVLLITHNPEHAALGQQLLELGQSGYAEA